MEVGVKTIDPAVDFARNIVVAVLCGGAAPPDTAGGEGAVPSAGEGGPAGMPPVDDSVTPPATGEGGPVIR